MNEVIIAALVIGGLGAVFGIGLAYASKVFAVNVDERITRVKNILPGANCGGCGYAGCDGFAEAVVAGKAKTNACTVGGDVVAIQIAEILGVEPSAVDRRNARVFCCGNCKVSREKYVYTGIDECAAALQLYAGHKACSYGCLGHGDCVRACQFDAISVVNGVAVVAEERCVACEQCVAACPKGLIKMVPSGNRFAVMCQSKDKGPVVKKNCDVGCIGCARCVKACNYGAIAMEGTLSRIDPYKCVNCGECAKVCPTNAIREIKYEEVFKCHFNGF